MKKFFLASLMLLCFDVFTAISAEVILFNREKVENIEKGTELTATPIPVDPAKKYRIQFKGSATGEYTLEENERVRIMYKRYKANRLRFTFYDKTGEEFPFNYSDIMVLSNKSHEYVRIFYPPTKADTMRVFLNPVKGDKMTIEEITLKTDLEGIESQYLNTHATFDYGDLNTYGFSCGGGGKFYTRPDGKTVWNTGFIGWSPFFPVQGKKYYKFFCRGKKSIGKGWIWINFYKEDGEKIKNARIEINEKGAETILLMPKETAMAKLQCYYVIIEEFTVTESKNEK
jgi:hypothetical protein